MKKNIKDVWRELYQLDDSYTQEIADSASEVLQRIDSAMWDFIDALDHPHADRVRANMMNNIDSAFFELEGLRDLLADQERIKKLDQQRLLEAIKGV